MKIYVDEMPKSWYECTFAEVKNGVGNGHWCMLRNGICPRLSEKTANEHKKLIKDLCPLNLLVTCPQIAEKEQEIERLKKK